jgi:hypothetical protein
MARETICVDVRNPADVEAAEKWLAANRSRLDFLSENDGCGCCVDLYDLEGPEEVLQTIPEQLRCWSPWVRGEEDHITPVRLIRAPVDELGEGERG